MPPRAPAATASFGRNIVNLAFLAAATVAVLLMTRSNPHQAQVFTVPVYLRNAVELTPATSSQPTEFEKESALTSSQLLRRWDPLIAEAAQRFGISASWIRTVMRMESGGRTMLAEGQPIRSPVGAVGLMQLMPETYDEMRSQYGLGADADDPHDNIIAGTAYLSWLYHRYGFPNMFAAYNTGLGNLEAHLKGARELPAETQAYLAGIERVLGVKTRRARRRTAAFATLTRPDGSSISIDRLAVRAVRAAMPGEYAAAVHSVVTIGRKRLGIRETVAQAQAALG